MGCMIVPPYLLAQLAQLEDPRFHTAARAARQALLHARPFRSPRGNGVGLLHEGAAQVASQLGAMPPTLQAPQRTIFDAGNTQNLPGVPVRYEGDPTSDDRFVNEAYEGLGRTHELYRTQFSRASIDNENVPLHATVHYGENYENAFWDGQRMVFGDGDGQVFHSFTSSLSVIGHELTHGVIQYSANLTYQRQSGALNESISDVFGALVEQHSHGQTANAARWLIGVGLFTEEVEGVALRSMSAPGSAYNDDVLGKDPQPDHMDHYIETVDDNGGVHLNSGIPNRAFFLTATTIGGYAWHDAGRIWYDTVTGGALPVDADFALFARLTSETAATLFGADSIQQRAVADAWQTVGVTE
ncbi:MAG: peptidase [Homoserinimonas sp.]|nr:peptidase [Homoserinimonas sp.]